MEQLILEQLEGTYTNLLALKKGKEDNENLDKALEGTIKNIVIIVNTYDVTPINKEVYKNLLESDTFINALKNIQRYFMFKVIKSGIFADELAEV
jgi:hypothetical protein